MKYLMIIAVALMIGCSALQQKGENYERAASMGANPQCVKILYSRNLGDATLAEMRCTGKLCDEVPACDDD